MTHLARPTYQVRCTYGRQQQDAVQIQESVSLHQELKIRTANRKLRADLNRGSKASHLNLNQRQFSCKQKILVH